MSLFSSLSPWKQQKTSSFLMFSTGVERDQWYKMDKWRRFKVHTVIKLHTVIPTDTTGSKLFKELESNNNIQRSKEILAKRSQKLSNPDHL